MRKTALVICAGLLLTSCLDSGDVRKVGGEKAPTPSASAMNIVDADLNITLAAPNVEIKNRTVPGFTRGVNLSNVLEAPSPGEWGETLSAEYFKYVRKAGFDHVRVPVRFSAHALEAAPYTIDEDFFEIVDWVINEAGKNRLCVLLDLHHYEALMTDPENHTERFKKLWEQISRRYRNLPDTVAFELLNEPCNKLTPDLLNPLMKETLELVRETNPSRLVFIDCYDWASTGWLDQMEVSFFDQNTIATFHMYQPVLFTHQGTSWMPSEYHAARIIFPGPPETPVAIDSAAVSAKWVSDWLRQYNWLDAASNPSGPKTVWEEFDRATQFIRKTGRRVYMGEFGVFDGADRRSRTIFLKMVRRESERRGIGWAYWPGSTHLREDIAILSGS